MPNHNSQAQTELIEAILRDTPLTNDQLTLLSEISMEVVRKHGRRAVREPQSFIALTAQLQLAQARSAKLEEALKELKAACKDVLLPSINEAIKKGYKMDTWSPEMMQWAKAVELVDAALLADTPEGEK